MIVQLFEGFQAATNRLYRQSGFVEPDYRWQLWVNDITPTKDSVKSDFTFLTLSPWAAISTNDFGYGSIVEQSDGSALTTNGVYYLALDDYTGSDVTIYGWLLYDDANDVGVLAERYGTPIVLPQTGPVILLNVTTQLGHYAP